MTQSIHLHVYVPIFEHIIIIAACGQQGLHVDASTPLVGYPPNHQGGIYQVARPRVSTCESFYLHPSHLPATISLLN
jgi:hypothetical protein